MTLFKLRKYVKIWDSQIAPAQIRKMRKPQLQKMALAFFEEVLFFLILICFTK